MNVLYSRCYFRGWIPLALLMALPIVAYRDLSSVQIGAAYALVIAGWVVIRFAQQGAAPAIVPPSPETAQRHLRAALLFSVLSLIGCRLVLRDQGSTLSGESFENLQERYIALTEAALSGDATFSIWSSLGNLLRSFFFVAIASYVAYTKEGRSFWPKLLLTAVVGLALLENFQLYVSRLQFVFYLLTAVIAAGIVGHPILRRKGLILSIVGLLALFLVVTSGQRFDAKFGDEDEASAYIATLFGVDPQPLGQWIASRLGAAPFALSLYVIQGIPEMIRLILNNPSPYEWGAHSLFLLLSPLMRLVGMQLVPSAQPISNQGFWWGYMGDLYLDFGVLFPIAYLLSLYLMVRAAIRIGRGPVYGLAFRTLTAGMITIVPYTGIFNTFCVSYFALLYFAMRENNASRAVRASDRAPSPDIHASTSPTRLRP